MLPVSQECTWYPSCSPFCCCTVRGLPHSGHGRRSGSSEERNPNLSGHTCRWLGQQVRALLLPRAALTILPSNKPTFAGSLTFGLWFKPSTGQVTSSSGRVPLVQALGHGAELAWGVILEQEQPQGLSGAQASKVSSAGSEAPMPQDGIWTQHVTKTICWACCRCTFVLVRQHAELPAETLCMVRQ